jgi:membrane fusion protein (multidrug efflux system)
LPHNQEGCVVIPQHATFEVQDKTYVYQIVNGVAKTKIVSVFEINDGKEYIVQSGILAGDTIIANGIGTVRENAPIKIKGFVTPVE